MHIHAVYADVHAVCPVMHMAADLNVLCALAVMSSLVHSYHKHV